ncbi:IclR family transcriptional regulator [Rhizobium sp. P32RR-XVIII]|uniref:IclR family transcriptional regulator n=1 Tax=Rhizobium sp. P32RR-XVIII TaxID=2726738 RepID=UPI0014578C5C|nr:IclR family transcriptional regulator [Rhizobium sp. P32RR-XVIII]NLS02547.1 IclR family transcriptional regulator [Rhizobium sp. P32RR-XVIII]
MARGKGASRESETGTLGKVMALLELVTHSDGPMRFTDILALSSQPRGTLHRQLVHLVEEGLLEFDADGRYVPGLRLLDLASRSWARNEFRLITEPYLKDLQQMSGETVHLGVLRGTSIIYLDKIEGRQSVRMYSQIGNASPVYCTGVGKAALSVLPDDAVEPLARNLSFNRFTPHTLGSADALLQELKTIRETGVALDREEHELGIRCVAAAVWTVDGSFTGGVSITGPAYRLTLERLEEWTTPIKQAAQSIMDAIRIRLGPRG